MWPRLQGKRQKVKLDLCGRIDKLRVPGANGSRRGDWSSFSVMNRPTLSTACDFIQQLCLCSGCRTGQRQNNNNWAVYVYQVCHSRHLTGVGFDSGDRKSMSPMSNYGQTVAHRESELGNTPTTAPQSEQWLGYALENRRIGGLIPETRTDYLCRKLLCSRLHPIPYCEYLCFSLRGRNTQHPQMLWKVVRVLTNKYGSRNCFKAMCK